MKLLALLAAFSLPLLAADDYELKLSRPAKIGDRETKTGKYIENSRMAVTVDGKPVKSESTVINLEYTAESEALAVGAAGQTTSCRVKLVKISGDMNGKPLTQLVAGDEIVVSRKEGAREGKEIMVNKTAATPDQTKLISGFVSVANVGDTTDDDVFGTKKRVQAGEEWKLNQAAAVKKLEQSGLKGLDPAGVSGTSKFLGVAQVDGFKFLRVNGKIDVTGAGMPMPGMPPGANVKVTKLATKMEMESSVPADVNSRVIPSTIMQMEMQMQASGEMEKEGKTYKLEVAMEGKKAKMENSKKLE